MKKLLALLLALTMVLTLAACGRNNTADNGSENGGNTTVNNEQNDATEPEIPDETEPETSDETEEPSETESETTDEEQPEEPTEPELSLSHTDVTFKAAGSSFQLSVNGTEGAVTFASADETIATVAEDGTVTAVAPGTTTITAVAEGDMAFQCIIRCNWKNETEETPDQGGKGVDLKAFYTTVTENYTLSMGMSEMTEADLIENYFAGLSAISLKQQALYYTMFSMNNGEISMVEVENAADVETVKAIFQARVDYMINGGAWYPEPTEIWTNQSRIVSYGNYVLMVAGRDCDSIVADFEALVG